MNLSFKKGLALFILSLFLLGILPSASSNSGCAEARAKKKVYRKIKKVRVKKVVRRVKKIKRVVRKVKRKTKRIHEPAYKLPARTGTIIQKYTLEEGVDEAEAERVVGELKSLGADDASINVETSALQVKFNSGKLSAVGIMKKLKELGYTVKRID